MADLRNFAMEQAVREARDAECMAKRQAFFQNRAKLLVEACPTGSTEREARAALPRSPDRLLQPVEPILPTVAMHS